MKQGFTRRKVLGGLTLALSAPAILRATRSYASDPTIRIGLVSPRTGPIAGFAEADDYVLSGVRAAFSDGVVNNGKRYSVEIIAKDSQSNSNRAAEVTSELIDRDEVDIMVAAATPDTTNPVADQCELNEIPCVTTDCPWQPYFFGRNGNPATGFEYTYHFFWGLEDVIANFLNLWDSSGVSGRSVGGLFPNDADGNAWGDAELGFPKPLAARGYTIVDPGRFQLLNNDFTSQITAFKAANCEIVTGVMIPPDFATFWSQAAQQDFRPKVVTVGKALLFPSVIESLGDRADGLTTEVWWSPNHPFSSSLTGDTAKSLADGYTTSTGRPWTQPIGFKHALFEVVRDVISRSSDLDDSSAIVDAIKSTSLSTIVGPVGWSGSGNPVPNVSKTPLVAGQWQRGGSGFELVITNNKEYPSIPVGGSLKLINN